jgi:hypothetical protein
VFEAEGRIIPQGFEIEAGEILADGARNVDWSLSRPGFNPRNRRLAIIVVHGADASTPRTFAGSSSTMRNMARLPLGSRWR